jgi:hypothetical protein
METVTAFVSLAHKDKLGFPVDAVCQQDHDRQHCINKLVYEYKEMPKRWFPGLPNVVSARLSSRTGVSFSDSSPVKLRRDSGAMHPLSMLHCASPKPPTATSTVSTWDYDD